MPTSIKNKTSCKKYLDSKKDLNEQIKSLRMEIIFLNQKLRKFQAAIDVLISTDYENFCSRCPNKEAKEEEKRKKK